MDESLYGPEWKLKLKQVEANMSRRDLYNISNNSRYYNPKEVGFIHQKNKSCIRIMDNGDINMFVSETCGINIDEDVQTINMIGGTTNLVSQNINLYTTPDGLSWNGFYINPTLYTKIGRGVPKEDKNIRLVVNYDTWDEEYNRYETVTRTMPLFIKKSNQTIYNDLVTDLIRDLDIPL
jgi:hypothetical protein